MGFLSNFTKNLQPVVTVEMNVKYHLDHERIDQYTVTSVSQITKISKDCFDFDLVLVFYFIIFNWM